MRKSSSTKENKPQTQVQEEKPVKKPEVTKEAEENKEPAAKAPEEDRSDKTSETPAEPVKEKKTTGKQKSKDDSERNVKEEPAKEDTKEEKPEEVTSKEKPAEKKKVFDKEKYDKSMFNMFVTIVFALCIAYVILIGLQVANLIALNNIDTNLRKKAYYVRETSADAYQYGEHINPATDKEIKDYITEYPEKDEYSSNPATRYYIADDNGRYAELYRVYGYINDEKVEYQTYITDYVVEEDYYYFYSNRGNTLKIDKSGTIGFIYDHQGYIFATLKNPTICRDRDLNERARTNSDGNKENEDILDSVTVIKDPASYNEEFNASDSKTYGPENTTNEEKGSYIYTPESDEYSYSVVDGNPTITLF